MTQDPLYPLARALGAALSATGQAQRRGLDGVPRAPSEHATCRAQLKDALATVQAVSLLMVSFGMLEP